MNEIFQMFQAWYNNLPEAQANFLTSGFFIMMVVMIMIKFVLKGVVKWLAILVIFGISAFWLTGYEVPFLTEYFAPKD